MIGPRFALLTLAAFTALASFSLGRADQWRSTYRVAKPVELWHAHMTPEQTRAETVAMIFNVTPVNMNAYKEWWK